MIELLDRSAPPTTRAQRVAPVVDADVTSSATSLAKPPSTHILAAVLDELDYPMLLVERRMHLLHGNKSARRGLDEGDPFRLQSGELQLRCDADQSVLCRAVETACDHHLRGLIQVRDARGRQAAVAVVPLRHGDDPNAALLMLGRTRVCEELSVHGYARENCLTAGEARVLRGLCMGQSAQAIASSHGVAVSTVRSQVSSLRAKTGAKNIADLVRKVAVLPPLVNALQMGS